MKNTRNLTDSVFTPFSLVMISIVAIIAVAVALFQVNRGPLAPTAPQESQAADFSSQNCSLPFTVPGAVIDLELDKDSNNSTPTVGEEVTFTLVITNNGPDIATGVTVQDILPTGLTFISSDAAVNQPYDSTTGIWNIGSMGPSTSITLNIIAEVTQAGPITNYAQVETASPNDTDSTPGDDSTDDDDDDSVTLNSGEPEIDLELEKGVSDNTPLFGQNITFTLDLENGGPENATNVTVRDVLPEGLIYVSHNAAADTTFDNATSTWTVGNLAADTSVRLEIVATVNSTTPRTNYAQVQTSSPTDSDSTPGNNSGDGTVPDEDDDDSVTIIPETPASPTPTNTPAPSADLRLTKTIVENSTPRVNENVKYRIEVYNAGPDTATNVTVREPLMGGVTFVSANPSQGTYNVSTGIWTVGTIAINETKSLEITVTVNTTGALTNISQVQTSDQPDPNSEPGNNDPTENDQDTETINPERPGADLSLIKRVNNSRPTVGQNVVFTIEVHNSGPQQADNVTVKDLVPAGTTLISTNPSQGSYNSGNGIWTIGSMTKDFTVRMEMTLRIDRVANVVNVAEVQTSSQPDPNSTPGNNNPNEDDQDDAPLFMEGTPVLPKAGNTSRTTLFVIATGVIVLIIGAMGLLLLL